MKSSHPGRSHGCVQMALSQSLAKIRPHIGPGWQWCIGFDMHVQPLTNPCTSPPSPLYIKCFHGFYRYNVGSIDAMSYVYLHCSLVLIDLKLSFYFCFLIPSNSAFLRASSSDFTMHLLVFDIKL